MVGAKVNYSSMEKNCLSLAFAVQKLRHYLLSHKIILISKADLLRYVLSKITTLPDDLPDDEVVFTEIKTWQLYFDEAVRSRGARVGIVFITSSGALIPDSFSLLEVCSNNVVEYEALIIGLELAL